MCRVQACEKSVEISAVGSEKDEWVSCSGRAVGLEAVIIRSSEECCMKKGLQQRGARGGKGDKNRRSSGRAK